MKLETIRFEKPKDGYAPSDDSWLLARVIHEHASLIKGKKTLDMGCGSGIQTAALLLSGATHVTCVDLNPFALLATKKIMQTYFQQGKIDYVESNLFEKIKGKFDVMVFNPPYVPSDELKWMEVDGGEEGRVVIDQFMSQFPKFLSKTGVCFLLQSSLNGTELTQTKLSKKHLKSEVVGHVKLSFEELVVLKIEWS